MNCRNCGAPIRDGALFCARCGAPAAPAAAADPRATAQQTMQSNGPTQSVKVPYPQMQPGAAPTFGAARPNVVPPPQPGLDWERLQSRKSPAGATALIVGVSLLLIAAVLLIWGVAL